MELQHLLAVGIGILLVTILGQLWLKKIEYKKTGKIQILEHYHFGIMLVAVGVLFHEVGIVMHALIGSGFAFFYQEAKQNHLFAYGSTHFKKSTVIGILLTAATIIILVLI